MSQQYDPDRIAEIEEHLVKSEINPMELGVSFRDQASVVHMWYPTDVRYLLSLVKQQNEIIERYKDFCRKWMEEDIDHDEG